MCSDDDEDDDGRVKLPGSKARPHGLPSSRTSGHVCSQRRPWGKQGESQSSPWNSPGFEIGPAAPWQQAQLAEGTSDRRGAGLGHRRGRTGLAPTARLALPTCPLIRDTTSSQALGNERLQKQ